MIFNLSEYRSIAHQFLAELRDVKIQQDRMRFRRNVERLGEIFAYEISKTLSYQPADLETPLGSLQIPLPVDRIVIASILRAGLPLQQGMLSFFDQAENAFISAYRKHHKDGTFEINQEYVTCPNLTDSILIITDPMLATGASFQAAIKVLEPYGTPNSTHIVSCVASTYGVNFIQRIYPDERMWLGAIDEELTAKSYIVPGLGDAGDLMFGQKVQD
jgi:uracil phosphoribosyltransferase